MAKAPSDDNAFDRFAYAQAEQQFRLAEERLPPDAVQALAREVVRRLAFRMPGKVKKSDLPTATDIDRLCAALLSRDETAASGFLMSLQRDAISLNTVYLSYIAGAARRLGEMWDDDRISFVEVTLACAKLYRIIRGLRHTIGADIVENRDERPALFTLVPGETHTLGIEIATDIFRREGWDVDMAVGLSHDMLILQTERRHYGAIVLVANGEAMLAPLIRLALALRIANPMAHVVVAGNIVDQVPDVSDLAGADAVIRDIETAIAKLRSVMDRPV